MQKHSRQREAIKAYLDTHRTHPTAEQVYANVRVEFPKISLGTVYRNLSLLTSIGEIQRIVCGDESDHFDANITPPAHVCCCRCGKVEDVECQIPRSLMKHAQSNYDGEILSQSVVFQGICVTCLIEEEDVRTH